MEGFKFSREALGYEQEKSEKLLREIKKGAFEMSEAESGEFLDSMGEYRKGLEDAVREKKTKLKKTKDHKTKLALADEIEELKAQIAGFEDFEEAGKDAEEFIIKDFKQ